MDFLNDQSGRHLLRIDGMVTVPDYVKQANIDAEAMGDLPITCFADPVKREFPMHTSAHVYLSYAYCKSASVSNPLILERVKKAAVKLGTSKDLDTIDQAFGQIKRATASPTVGRFAVSIDFGEEKTASLKGVQGFYPINDADETQSSAVALDNHKNQLPLSVYVGGSKEIVKAASEHNMETRLLPGRILLYGTEHFPDFSHVLHEASRREMDTGDSAYREIAKMASENIENREMEDYIKLWELADASNGLKYSFSIPDPFRIFNTGESKKAHEAQLDEHAVLAGAIIPTEALTQLDAALVKKQFPKAAAALVEGLIKMAKEHQSGDALTAAASGLDLPVQRKLLNLVLAVTE